LFDPVLSVIRVRLGDLRFRVRHRGEHSGQWFWLLAEREVCVAGELSAARSHALASYVAEHQRAARFGPPFDTAAEHYTFNTLYKQVFDELRVIERRLIGDQPDLYAEAVRLRSEGELRSAITPPLAALTIVLASSVGPWWVALTVLGIGLAVVAVLWELGHRRRRASNDLLVEALALDRVAAPTIDRMHANAEKVRAAKTRLERASHAQMEP
jgi:hypothetical protein